MGQCWAGTLSCSSSGLSPEVVAFLRSAFSALWERGNCAFSSILHSKTCCQTYRQVASETCLGVFPGPPHCPETHS